VGGGWGAGVWGGGGGGGVWWWVGGGMVEGCVCGGWVGGGGGGGGGGWLVVVVVGGGGLKRVPALGPPAPYSKGSYFLALPTPMPGRWVLSRAAGEDLFTPFFT
jgi:hypothetical protein